MHKSGKKPRLFYYNILGQLYKHVSKLACYFAYIPAHVVVAWQRH